MTIAEFLTKYNTRFADNTTGEIDPEDLRLFAKDISEVFVSGPPPAPTNVFWNEAPQVDISGNNLNVSDGEVINQGNVIPVDTTTITLPTVAAGYQRPYVLVANYLATPAVYEIVAGLVNAENASYVFPSIPPNRLRVADFMLNNAGVVQLPTDVVKSIIFNGIEYFPNALGQVIINSNYTPPVGFTAITNATATPLSDTEIQLNITLQ